MASISSSHRQNAFSGIEPPNKRRKIEQSSELYDVFINHRGPDVKHTLATDLYYSLQRLGIRAFLDSQEKELGTSVLSTIEVAISSASVHIAIFSEGYAESAWCLTELVLMLQSNARIIPVFYHVKPHDLRHIESGVYDGAFHKYKEKGRYMEKLTEWKQALQSVSYTRGYEFGAPGSGDCKEILSAVEKEVQRRKPLHVAKHPVGLHKLVKDFESMCLRDLVQDFESHRRMNRAGKEKGNVVGIFGMGGVGKTTLSKELFNQRKSKYTTASFLFDVREASARAELPGLQSKLLNDLFGKNGCFLNIDEGTSCLRNSFERGGSSSFLIVLDDIDHADQVDALIPMDILSQYNNSLVIITTRDVGVLASAGIENGYRLKGLDREDGKALFCWHAFNQPHPGSGYEDLVEKFVNTCGGLPLSLQVLGRHVSRRDKRFWSEELKKVSQTLPGDVKKKLKISFDSLDNEQKQVFMDVACFFIDRLKTMAMTIWEGSGWSSHHSLEKLKDKCLLEEVEPRYRPFVDGKLKSGRNRYVLRMHDHLRDLGREMANELSHPHRVWQPKHLKSLELKGFQKIVAQTKGRCFHSIRDESMGCQITYFIEEPQDSSDISLLWLQLDYPKYREPVLNSGIKPNIPPWVPLQYLQCLRISGGCFRRLWQSDMQAPSHLKELHIAGTFLEEFPYLSGKQKKMEVVVLDAKHFQMDIWSLLRSLRMDLCSLNVMGREFTGYLTCPFTEQKTQSLVISDFKLPQEEEVSLNNYGCSIMGKVKELEIKCRHLVKKIVITGDCCQCLQSLKIFKMENVIEVNLERMKTLDFLEITDCRFLKRLSLIPDLSQLSTLKIEKCSVLESVSGILDLTKLRQLYIKECHMLGELPDLVRLCWLEQIELDNCNELQNIMLPTALIRLSVQSCRNLQRIAGNLTKLTELYISDCPELEVLPSLCGVSCLKKVEIYSCQKLKKITLPSKFISLSVRNCRSLQRIAGSLTEFKAVYINVCPQLEELPSFCRVTCSDQIQIESCEKLHSITLPTALIRLSVRSCRDLQRVASGLTMLTALYINDCPQLDEFPCFSRVSCLEQIRIYSCKKLKYIQLPTELISLSVRNCRDLQRVAGDLTKLTALYIRDSPQLQELPSLSQVNCLEQIAVYSCKKLQHITLPTTLISLCIRSCRDLQRIAVNGDLAKLTKLIIAHCPELEELPAICGKCNFRIFVIDSCEKLQTISLGEELQTKSVGKESQTIVDAKYLQTILQAISDGKDLQNSSEGEDLHLSKYMRLWYCSNAVIKSTIRNLESVPRRMDMIGRAVDAAEQISNAFLTCHPTFSFGVNRTCRNYVPNWSKLSSVIACFVVIGLCTPERYMSKSLSKYHYSENDYSYDYEFDSDSDSDSDSYHGLHMSRGKWIITMVASDEWSYSCLEEVENLLWHRGIIETGFCKEIEKDEENTSLQVLHSIVDLIMY